MKIDTNTLEQGCFLPLNVYTARSILEDLPTSPGSDDLFEATTLNFLENLQTALDLAQGTVFGQEGMRAFVVIEITGSA